MSGAEEKIGLRMAEKKILGTVVLDLIVSEALDSGWSLLCSARREWRYTALISAKYFVSQIGFCIRETTWAASFSLRNADAFVDRLWADHPASKGIFFFFLPPILPRFTQYPAQKSGLLRLALPVSVADTRNTGKSCFTPLFYLLVRRYLVNNIIRVKNIILVVPWYNMLWWDYK